MFFTASSTGIAPGRSPNGFKLGTVRPECRPPILVLVIFNDDLELILQETSPCGGMVIHSKLAMSVERIGYGLKNSLRSG